ncbi:zinc-dependent metalloprotease [Chryseobacterium oryctis]|uniref:Zinc-dependent metalloprotease n=1 Tax=Chryseobacterium oryctis TaxID=2952618 RepID=A0ABT3HKR2_9FLAO|nr:zinc-dependent metalloprotease [Chryseobacterium oryctis]MCW3160346.1 zinc-dependent metalloprotease [Chryseobacterium oryctis]
MKNINRISALLLLMFFSNAFSQNLEKYCGFDEELRKMDVRFPELKKKREDVETKLRKMDKQSFLNKVGGSTSWNGLYTGQVYEIPVVVHVIESQAASNANLSLTDQQIIDWVDRANKMYATTYGNGFYPEGPGNDGGNVIPFKLVLAKRSPSCTPTSGIVRYNGSSLPLYDTRGVKMNSSSGATDSQIKALAPHWPETSYFNIYVVIGFDGQQQNASGLMGYARFPEIYDYFYESFMKVATVKNLHDTTLTHELGHAFGLYHTFEGISYTNQTSCPVNNNCSTDGDRICDTSPSRSMYGVAVPGNNSIDPCTGQNYDGTQYNIMNYTNDERKFTQGQRERAVLLMMEYRKNLLNSTAGKDPSVVVPSPVSIIASQCNPPSIANPTNNNFAIGATRVQFGSINSMTNGYDSDESAPQFYEDYSVANCIRPAYYTDIASGSSTELKVTFSNGFGQSDKMKAKVWIDYNNNGAFEESELIANATSAVLASGGEVTLTNNITPPAGAVKNAYLRMRVMVDAATYNGASLPDFTACSQLQYGQAEDYAVRILDVLETTDVKNRSEAKLVYLKSENKLQLVGDKNDIFGDYQIYDLNGKLIQKGNSKTNEVQINQQLSKGVYIINYSDKKESKKFLN